MNKKFVFVVLISFLLSYALSAHYIKDSKLEVLQDLPKDITDLTIENCENLKRFEEPLHNKIQSLRIISCRNLHLTPEDLPADLDHLELNCMGHLGFNFLQSLMRRCSKLRTFSLGAWHELTTLPDLPRSLESLRLGGCLALFERPLAVSRLADAIPGTLQHLTIETALGFKDVHLQALLKRLKRLEELNISSAFGLRHIHEALPRTLKHLGLYTCQNLERLPQLYTTNLVSLELINLWKVTELPVLPDTVEHLTLDNCYRMERFQSTLSTHLKKLYLAYMDGLSNEHVNNRFLFNYEHLRELTIYQCKNITGLLLGNYKKLNYLKVAGCPELTTLVLPNTLTQFILGTCLKLKSMPKLSQTLLILTIYGCPQLFVDHDSFISKFVTTSTFGSKRYRCPKLGRLEIVGAQNALVDKLRSALSNSCVVTNASGSQRGSTDLFAS